MRRGLRLLAVACVAVGLSLLGDIAYQIWDPGAAGVQRSLYKLRS